jgi:hypothetical protein
MRLRDMLGEQFDEMILLNLFDQPQPRQGKGSRFSVQAAVRRARDVVFCTPVVVFAGHRVARAFGFKARYFDPVLYRERHLAYVIPHPSGVNRWWNNEFNRWRAAKRFSEIINAANCPDCESRARVEAREAGRIVPCRKS